MKKIEIVVPCYNEAKCINLIYKAVENVFSNQLTKYDWNMLFVDDGSNDDTLDEIKELEEYFWILPKKKPSYRG